MKMFWRSNRFLSRLFGGELAITHIAIRCCFLSRLFGGELYKQSDLIVYCFLSRLFGGELVLDRI